MVLVVILIVSAASLLAAGDPTGRRLTQWEYGVYRVGGQYRYEWQNTNRRVYGPTQRVFLERMGLQSVAVKLQSMTDAPSYALRYVLEAEFLNHLGTEGWELVVVIDKGRAGMANRTFWFKRPK